MDFLTALKNFENYTETENGAIALRSTGRAILDAFSILPTMRTYYNKAFAVNLFDEAYKEDSTLAMRLLFYVRDIRGGQGSRAVFRDIMKHLAYTRPQLVIKNLDNFLYYGRGDDILCLLDTPIKKDVIAWIDQALSYDLGNCAFGRKVSLLGKWLPSENASSPITKRYAKMIIKGTRLSPKQYRKILTNLRKKINIVETKMSDNQWEDIDYSTLPSKAGLIYANAFYEHTPEKYLNYVAKLVNGSDKINAGAVFPVDILHKLKVCALLEQWGNHYKPSAKDDILCTAMWNALPNYFKDKEETGICVVDTSGSMSGLPMEVAVSLGMYCADKAKGPYHNHFITFSRKPKLQELKGNTLAEKIMSINANDWGCNTDLEAVFDLILDTAISHNISKEEMPNKLYIISDMQFDEATSVSVPYGFWERKPKEPFMETMKKKYAHAGYDMPMIIYWNVRTSNYGMFQATYQGENCAIVGGYSPSLFKSVIEGTEFIQEEVITTTGEKKTVVRQKLDPMTVMLKTLMSQRYDKVVVE